MDNSSGPTRPGGVMKSTTTRAGAVPEMTVLDVAEVRTVAVRWGDERGREHTALCYVFGDRAYIHSQAEAYTSSLGHFAGDLNAQIIEKLLDKKAQETGPVQLPKKDEVDV